MWLASSSRCGGTCRSRTGTTASRCRCATRRATRMCTRTGRRSMCRCRRRRWRQARAAGCSGTQRCRWGSARGSLAWGPRGSGWRSRGARKSSEPRARQNSRGAARPPGFSFFLPPANSGCRRVAPGGPTHRLHNRPPQSSRRAATLSATSGLESLAKDLGAQEFWIRRLAAVILDGAVVGVALFALSLGPLPLRALELGAAGGLALYLYTVLFEFFRGQTPGKWLLGLRVVGVGSKVDLSRLFVRAVSKVFVLALVLDVGAGLLVEKNGRQRYLEVLSGTTEVLDR